MRVCSNPECHRTIENGRCPSGCSIDTWPPIDDAPAGRVRRQEIVALEVKERTPAEERELERLRFLERVQRVEVRR